MSMCGSKMLFGLGVVLVQEMDDADIVVEGDLVGFWKGGQRGHVIGGSTEGADDVFCKSDRVQLEERGVSAGRGNQRRMVVCVP